MQKIENVQPLIDNMEAKLAALGFHESSDTIDDSGVKEQFAPTTEKSYINTGLSIEEFLEAIKDMPAQSRVQYSNIKDQIAIHHVRPETPEEFAHRKKLFRDNAFARWKHEHDQLSHDLQAAKDLRDRQVEYLHHLMAAYGYDVVKVA